MVLGGLVGLLVREDGGGGGAVGPVCDGELFLGLDVRVGLAVREGAAVVVEA